MQSAMFKWTKLNCFNNTVVCPFLPKLQHTATMLRSHYLVQLYQFKSKRDRIYIAPLNPANQAYGYYLAVAHVQFRLAMIVR